MTNAKVVQAQVVGHVKLQPRREVNVSRGHWVNGKLVPGQDGRQGQRPHPSAAKATAPVVKAVPAAKPIDRFTNQQMMQELQYLKKCVASDRKRLEQFGKIRVAANDLVEALAHEEGLSETQAVAENRLVALEALKAALALLP